MKIVHLDHLVLTVADIDKTVDFYTRVLGMTPVNFAKDRTALKFGNQKINLHEHGKEFEPKAHWPMPGSADLCFLIATDIDEAMKHLRDEGVSIIEGPVQRTGSQGPIRSIYFRDPDGNLIELANPM